jgi:glycosyltransferase involved in cell wall biosynthesis
MRVVFLGDSISNQRAGIHYFGQQLVNFIIASYPQHEYYMVCSQPVAGLDLEQIIVPVNQAFPGHLRWRQLVSIPQLINQMAANLVIELAHFGPFNLNRKIKRVTVIHDLTPIKFPNLHPFSSVWAHKLLLKGIVHRADHIIVNSTRTKLDVMDLYNKDERLISIFHPEPQLFSEISGMLDDSEISRPFFLTVGTREPRKNHLTILRAFEDFRKTNVGYDLVIAGGEGWKNDVFENAWKDSPEKKHIILTGYIPREKLSALYRKATAFIFASIYEGFGLPILEAQSFGLPLVLSDNKSLSEIARGAALLFDPYDSKMLSNYMTQLAESDSLQKDLNRRSKKALQEHLLLKPDLGKIFES